MDFESFVQQLEHLDLNEFFSFFGVKRTPEKIQNIIDNDPVLQKLQADFKKMNNKIK